ncbi:MAG: hypothetical protein JXX14_14650, partial [Deltaproteobacteria bacterium]|nr:hypothetical protein [Deltaproteobacteria bacterium]
GYAQTPEQADNWRLSVASIFPGLYFSGAWGRGGGGGYMGTIVNGRVAALQVLARHSWRGAEKVFDVAKRPLFSIRKTVDGAAAKEVVTSPKKKNSYRFAVAASDISAAGELNADTSIRLLNDAANAYIGDNKAFLSNIWPNFNINALWHTAFFQMRFVFVPFVTVSDGDDVSVEVEFEPTAPGKGQFTQNIYLTSSGQRLANADGRVLIRAT